MLRPRKQGPPDERDFLHRLVESRAIKLGSLGVLSADDVRRLARDAALPVAELRRRIAQARGSR